MTKTRPSGKSRHGLRALFTLAALAVSGLALGASSASAATPCWKQVLNDWFVDGRIDHTYPIACYTQAQQHLGEDAVNYSGAPDDIHRALLAAIRQDRAAAVRHAVAAAALTRADRQQQLRQQRDSSSPSLLRATRVDPAGDRLDRPSNANRFRCRC